MCGTLYRVAADRSRYISDMLPPPEVTTVPETQKPSHIAASVTVDEVGVQAHYISHSKPSSLISYMPLCRYCLLIF